MLRSLVCAATLLWPLAVQAADVGQIVDAHILPGYERLASETAALSDAATDDCSPESSNLLAAYHNAFDAWVAVSHLRFGPSEDNDRAFSIYFWPDTRGATQKTLATLIRDEDPVAFDPDAFQAVSIAARGFFALEFLLFDDAFRELGSADYRCALTQGIAGSLASNSAAIQRDWLETYADLMRNAGANDTYRSEDEALRQVFTALTTGLQFTSDARLGRPMGTFDRPRPNRAEARRSERSLRHVEISVRASRELASLLSDGNETLDAQFVRALDRIANLDDPSLAGVAEPQGRIRVEVIQQNIDLIRQSIAEELGPELGIAAGFNSLDGD